MAEDLPLIVGTTLQHRRPDLVSPLTSTQRLVLPYLLSGYNIPTTARLIHRSTETVRSHAQAIYRSTNVTSHTSLIALFGAAPPPLSLSFLDHSLLTSLLSAYPAPFSLSLFPSDSPTRAAAARLISHSLAYSSGPDSILPHIHAASLYHACHPSPPPSEASSVPSQPATPPPTSPPSRTSPAPSPPTPSSRRAPRPIPPTS